MIDDLPERIKEPGVTAFGEPVGILTHPSHFQYDYLSDADFDISL